MCAIIRRFYLITPVDVTYAMDLAFPPFIDALLCSLLCPEHTRPSFFDFSTYASLFLEPSFLHPSAWGYEALDESLWLSCLDSGGGEEAELAF